MLPSSRMVRFAAMIVLASAAALAQSGQSASQGQSGSARTPGDQRPGNRPIFLKGRVLIDNGTEPPQKVVIERVCGGNVQREASTDSHGYFEFNVGRDVRTLQDASIGSFRRADTMTSTSRRPGSPLEDRTVTEADLKSCELRASLPGYRSDTVPLEGHTISNPEIGVIMLHPAGHTEGSTVSVTTLNAPKAAKSALEQARKALAKGKTEEAQRRLEEAVSTYPNFAQALVELGVLYREAKRDAEAKHVFEQALASDPKFLPPYFQLALLTAQAGEWQRVAELTDKALELDAFNYPSAYFYNAVAYFNLQKFEQAEKSARAARRLDSKYQIPRIDLVLSRILEQRQDYGGAAEELRSYLKYVPDGPEAAQVRADLANLESKLAAKKPQ